MRHAVIVDAVRSSKGKGMGKRMGKGRPGGALFSVHPVDLPGQVMRAHVAARGISASEWRRPGRLRSTKPWQ